MGGGPAADLCDQGCHGVVPQVQPLHNAGGDGQHVLQGSTDLDPRHVGGGVDAHVGAGKQLLHLPGQLGVLQTPLPLSRCQGSNKDEHYWALQEVKRTSEEV